MRSAQEHGERAVADVRPGTQHRVTEALRLALTDEVDVSEITRVDDPSQTTRVALLHQLHLELGNRVEVVGDRVLVAADDDEDVVDPS